jgi:hypothetical protein
VRLARLEAVKTVLLDRVGAPVEVARAVLASSGSPPDVEAVSRFGFGASGVRFDRGANR